MSQSQSDDDVVREALERAGWYPGRRERAQAESWIERLAHLQRSFPSRFEVFPAALEALSEFGGVHVVSRGPGVDFARSSFRIDPRVAADEVERFEYYAAMIGVKLYPLGEQDDGYTFIAIDESARVYIFMSGDTIDLVAGSMYEAAKSFILGRRVV